MDCYAITQKQFQTHCPFPLLVLRDHAALNAEAARRIVALVKQNNESGKETSLILPVGPLHYEPLAEICNSQRISLERLTLFMMDEYLDRHRQTAICESHPLSFTRFMKNSFVARLDPALGFSEDRLIFPLPDRMDEVSDRILSTGGVDICFGGIGISGHLAFNDPPEPDEASKGLDWVRNCRTRVVDISRESCTQMALTGTHGNWDVIPRSAVTLGMKEVLASRKICLCAMRTWHSGTIRRALFGPVSADCPASLVQEHPDVELLITEVALHPPLVNITLDTGEDDSPDVRRSTEP